MLYIAMLNGFPFKSSLSFPFEFKAFCFESIQPYQLCLPQAIIMSVCFGVCVLSKNQLIVNCIERWVERDGGVVIHA